MAYIYKFNINGKSYVGSTKNIRKRMNKHKSTCYNQNNKKYNFKLYKFIRENGGWDNVDIHILQKCNKSVKRIVEDFYMKHYNCELNDRGAIFNREKKKEYLKEYYKNNNEYRKDYANEYRKNNKEKLSEKFNCICGGKYTHSNKALHLKTLKHQTYLESLSSSSSSSCQSAGLKKSAS